MKRIIKWMLGLFGLRLVKEKFTRRRLPEPTIDNIEIVARFYSLMKYRFTLIQIGACDGLTSDSIFRYVRNGGANAILIEPAPLNFIKLQSFYEGISGVTLVNAAVSDRIETRPFYTIRDEGRWKDDGKARQVASFFKEHVLRHAEEKEIQEQMINCVTLKSILEKYDISDLDVLLVDTEGYDGEIVHSALNNGIHPTFITFENVQLTRIYSQAQLNNLYEMLKVHGYVWTHDRINTLAIRNTFFNRPD